VYVRMRHAWRALRARWPFGPIREWPRRHPEWQPPTGPWSRTRGHVGPPQAEANRERMLSIRRTLGNMGWSHQA
jgi:hypothetical protein